MTDRPLINMLLPDLRLYFEDHANQPENLHMLAAELAHRKRGAAKKLHGKVLSRLAKLSASKAPRKNKGKKTQSKAKAEDSPTIKQDLGVLMKDRRIHDWDESQRLIIERDEDRMSLVEAGPGSGKTAVACKRIAHLVESKGVEASKILLISFSRAAIKELRDRIKFFAKDPIELAGLQIVTLDSFTWQMLHGFTDSAAAKLLQGYDGNISGFIDLLREPTDDIEEYLEELEHLVVDEAQDFVGDRATLTLALIEKLPDHCGVTIFADSAQAIYGFTAEHETDGPAEKTLIERLAEEGGRRFKHQHLINVYRTQDSKLLSLYDRGRKQLVGKSTADAEQWQTFRSFIKNNAHGIVSPVDKQDLTDRNDVLVLYRTRAEALMASSMLWSKDSPNKLRMSGIPPRTFPWIGRVFSSVTEPHLNEAEFSALWSELIGHGVEEMGVSCEQAWQILYDNVGQKRGRIGIARLRSLLGRDRPPIDFLIDERKLSGPVLGTIHASKGRESSIVQLMLPPEKLVTEDMDTRQIMEEQRVLFVGASRARGELMTGKGNTLYSRRLGTSGRTYRMMKPSKGNRVQAEIGRLDDVDVGSLVDEEYRTKKESFDLQNILWDQRIQPVELRSEYYPDLKRNLLLDVNDDSFIAALSERFSKGLWEIAKVFALERETGRLRPGSKIRFIRQVGVRTAVIPETHRETAHSPWRESGFVLVPVIFGFSTIYLNNWR